MDRVLELSGRERLVPQVLERAPHADARDREPEVRTISIRTSGAPPGASTPTPAKNDARKSAFAMV
jgi:hypothetical protein